VRLHLECAAQVRPTHLAKDKSALEKFKGLDYEFAQETGIQQPWIARLFQLLIRELIACHVPSIFFLIHNLIYLPSNYHPSPVS